MVQEPSFAINVLAGFGTSWPLRLRRQTVKRFRYISFRGDERESFDGAIGFSTVIASLVPALLIDISKKNYRARPMR
jgi:hypothetical protein